LPWCAEYISWGSLILSWQTEQFILLLFDDVVDKDLPADKTSTFFFKWFRADDFGDYVSGDSILPYQ
jgi:hypothetical protein